MEKKKQKSVAGAVVVILAALAKLVTEKGHAALSVSLLFILAVLVLIGAVYWLSTRIRANAAGRISGPGGTSSLKQNFPRASSRKPRPEAHPAAQAMHQFAPGSGREEQWKSLYEAGLITREEYRERMNRNTRRG